MMPSRWARPMEGHSHIRLALKTRFIGNGIATREIDCLTTSSQLRYAHHRREAFSLHFRPQRLQSKSQPRGKSTHLYRHSRISTAPFTPLLSSHISRSTRVPSVPSLSLTRAVKLIHPQSAVEASIAESHHFAITGPTRSPSLCLLTICLVITT